MNRDIIGNSVIGLALGFALSCIGFSSMTELHKMLRFSDQRLLYTFFLAVLLLAGSWKLIAKLAKTKPDWAPKPIHRGTIAGGLLFGIGWALQFVEQDARHAGMAGDEADMSEKDALENRERLAAGGEGGADDLAEFSLHPVEDGCPHRGLVREVAEQRPMGDADAVGDGLRGDSLGAVIARQFDHRGDHFSAALAGRQASALLACRRTGGCIQFIHWHRLKSK